jgi:hypothetical protein
VLSQVQRQPILLILSVATHDSAKRHTAMRFRVDDYLDHVSDLTTFVPRLKTSRDKSTSAVHPSIILVVVTTYEPRLTVCHPRRDPPRTATRRGIENLARRIVDVRKADRSDRQ